MTTKTKTYKNKSKIATGMAFLATFILYIGKDGLTEILPVEYAGIIPIIIYLAAYFVAQNTENKRVEVAEQMMLEELRDSCNCEDDDMDSTGEYDLEE
ncbi:MAG: hypothetical protein ACI389_02330 [Methanobrevibacter sp.]|uniref:hypothetical protein n=1 Tax=Methanobrevibacter sp. TaxID=66852 RepID=UPI003F12A833